MSPRVRVGTGLTGMLLTILAPGATGSAAADETPAPAAPAGAILATGEGHACVLTDSGGVRCWGQNGFGQLGYGHTDTIGDDESPASAGDVHLGGTATSVVAGSEHTCALLTTGAIRCWGRAQRGQLGYGSEDRIGDDETPADAGDVPLGGPAVAVAAGQVHTCALMATGTVRCWGGADYGKLGYPGPPADRGDDETVAELADPDVALSDVATAIAAGIHQTCALLGGTHLGQVQCWGRNNQGQLGLGHTATVGDDETHADGGTADVGAPVVAVDLGDNHTCGVTSSQRARCWGFNGNGELGYGNTTRIGDDEDPADAGDIDLDGSVTAVSGGYNHTCALMTSGGVRCWGAGWQGQTGYGSTTLIGHNAPLTDLADVSLGAAAVAVGAGSSYTCAVLADATVRCWGYNAYAQLGLGHTDDIGDDETPDAEPVVDLGASVDVPEPVDPPVEPEVPTPATVKPTVTAKANKQNRDRKPPYKWTVTGRVKGGFTASPTICGGTVTLKVKQNGRKVGPKRTTKVDDKCNYEKTVRAKSGKLKGKGKVKLTVKAIYGGHTSSKKILKGANSTVTVKAR